MNAPDEGPAEPGPETRPEGGTGPSPAPAEGERRGDRVLLFGFLGYVVLLALATYARLADDRDLLDLFRLDRWFTR